MRNSSSSRKASRRPSRGCFCLSVTLQRPVSSFATGMLSFSGGSLLGATVALGLPRRCKCQRHASRTSAGSSDSCFRSVAPEVYVLDLRNLIGEDGYGMLWQRVTWQVPATRSVELRWAVGQPRIHARSGCRQRASGTAKGGGRTPVAAPASAVARRRICGACVLLF